MVGDESCLREVQSSSHRTLWAPQSHSQHPDSTDPSKASHTEHPQGSGLEAPWTWGESPQRWRAYPSPSIPHPSPSILHPSSTPWKTQGIAPAGGQGSAKLPSSDAKAANPAGCWHSHTPRALLQQQQIPELGALGGADVSAEPSEPPRGQRALLAPAQNLQHLQLIPTAQRPPQLHTNHTSSSCP